MRVSISRCSVEGLGKANAWGTSLSSRNAVGTDASAVIALTVPESQ
jgi:hypothetical protein